MTKWSRTLTSFLTIISFSLSWPVASYGAYGLGKSNHNKLGSRKPQKKQSEIKASDPTNCLKSLDESDMETLGKILYSKNKVAKIGSAEAQIDFETQKDEIIKAFSGEERAAALMVLSHEKAKAMGALLDRVAYQAVRRKDSKLNENELGQIQEMVDAIEGKKDSKDFKSDDKFSKNEKSLLKEIVEKNLSNNVSIVDALNKKVEQSLGPAQVLLKEKGVKLNENGEWIFDETFDFAKIKRGNQKGNKDKKSMELMNALSHFFPEAVKVLTGENRGYALFGNRVVRNIPDPKQKFNPGKVYLDPVTNQYKHQETDWIWESEDLEGHLKKVNAIQKRFVRASEEFARMSKQKGSWIMMTGVVVEGMINLPIDWISPRTKAGDTKICPDPQSSANPLPLQGSSIDGLIKHYDDGTNSRTPIANLWSEQIRAEQILQEELGMIMRDMALAGASDQTLQAMRDQYASLRNKSDADLENGLKGMDLATKAIIVAPLAVLTSPFSLPAAGAGLITTSLGYAGLTLTVVSLATPAVLAMQSISEATAKGDSLSCAIFREGAIVPVKLVHTLKWGAMGPVLKKFAPYADKVLQKFVNVSDVRDAILKYSLMAPGTIVMGKEAVAKSIAWFKNSENMAALEESLKAEEKVGNEAHADVIRKLIKSAKEEKWEIALGLVGIAVGTADLANKIATPSKKQVAPAKKEDDSEGDGSTLPTVARDVQTTPSLGVGAPTTPSMPADVSGEKLISSGITATTMTYEFVSQLISGDSMKEAKVDDVLPGKIEEINPGLTSIAKLDVDNFVETSIKKSSLAYPHDSKAIEKYMQDYVDKNPLRVEVLPDGSLLLKSDHSNAAALHEMMERGLLSKEGFKPKVKIIKNYYTDPAWKSKEKDKAMEEVLSEYYTKGEIAFSEDIKEKVDKKEMSILAAYNSTIPKNIKFVENKPMRSMIESMEKEWGIPLGNVNKVLDFYSAKNLKENFDIELSKEFNPTSAVSRASLMSLLLSKPAYIDYLKKSMESLKENDKAIALKKLERLAKSGSWYYARYKAFLAALVTKNPSMKNKIEKFTLLPEPPGLTEEGCDVLFTKQANEELVTLFNSPSKPSKAKTEKAK